MNTLEVRGLCKRYPEFSLRDVSFSVPAGHITGFIGRNGAGKTTTIKSALNLVHPDAGQIAYFGLDMARHEREIKQRIGYSTGTVNYYPKKKIGDIVAVTRAFYDTWDQAAYEEYRALFELDEGKCPGQLSEGMKVKFNLLLALSHGAEMLILDEPTSGLDPFSRDEILTCFLKLKARGVAILFSTHITSDLEKCADNIIYIRRGQIVADRTREDFSAQYGQPGESLEETILRLERSTAE